MTKNVHGLQRVAVSRNETGLLHIRDIMCALQTECIDFKIHNETELSVENKDFRNFKLSDA